MTYILSTIFVKEGGIDCRSKEQSIQANSKLENSSTNLFTE